MAKCCRVGLAVPCGRNSLEIPFVVFLLSFASAIFYCLLRKSLYLIAVPESVQREVDLSVWLHEEMVNHPTLTQLAKSLSSVLVQDRAPKTVSSYVRAYQTWKKWAAKCSATALPADPGVFALYLVHLIQQGSSVSLLNTAIYGASWVHKKSGYQELNEHPLIRQVAEAGRRILAKPPNRKKALDVSLVKRVISRLEHGNLVDIQVATLFALGFFGFLRWDDLSRLTVDNLQFADTHLAIFLVQRKNDQFRDGSWVFVARCSSSPCPVAVVEKFLKVGSHVKNSRLFRRILHTEKKMELRKEPMSYSRANELIKRELQKEELDPKLYGVHSLRAGGASAAAALGVPDRLFQRQGGWRSERSKNNYIQESTESLLTVTKTIQA